jgi:hypothetical protein
MNSTNVIYTQSVQTYRVRTLDLLWYIRHPLRLMSTKWWMFTVLTFESVMSSEIWRCVILLNTCQQFGMTCCIRLQGCSRYSILTTGLSTHTHLPQPYHTHLPWPYPPHLPWPYHTHLPWPYCVSKPNAGRREVKEAAEIKGDRKVSEHLMITIITTHVFLTSPLGSIWLLGSRPPSQGDTRLTLTPSNSNYVITVSDWNCLKYFCVFFNTVIIRCTETFWLPCSKIMERSSAWEATNSSVV